MLKLAEQEFYPPRHVFLDRVLREAELMRGFPLGKALDAAQPKDLAYPRRHHADRSLNTSEFLLARRMLFRGRVVINGIERSKVGYGADRDDFLLS